MIFILGSENTESNKRSWWAYSMIALFYAAEVDSIMQRQIEIKYKREQKMIPLMVVSLHKLWSKVLSSYWLWLDQMNEAVVHTCQKCLEHLSALGHSQIDKSLCRLQKLERQDISACFVIFNRYLSCYTVKNHLKRNENYKIE